MNVLKCTQRVSTALLRLSQGQVTRKYGVRPTIRALFPQTVGSSASNPLMTLRVLAVPSNFQALQCRSYGHGVEMTKHMLSERIMLILRLYDKINPEKLTLESQFTKDLGLDSLDHVELIMAVEDEFGFEIPDQDAERLRCPADIVQYLCDKLDVFE